MNRLEKFKKDLIKNGALDKQDFKISNKDINKTQIIGKTNEAGKINGVNIIFPQTAQPWVFGGSEFVDFLETFDNNGVLVNRYSERLRNEFYKEYLFTQTQDDQEWYDLFNDINESPLSYSFLRTQPLSANIIINKENYSFTEEDIFAKNWLAMRDYDGSYTFWFVEDVVKTSANNYALKLILDVTQTYPDIPIAQVRSMYRLPDRFTKNNENKWQFDFSPTSILGGEQPIIEKTIQEDDYLDGDSIILQAQPPTSLVEVPNVVVDKVVKNLYIQAYGRKGYIVSDQTLGYERSIISETKPNSVSESYPMTTGNDWIQQNSKGLITFKGTHEFFNYPFKLNVSMAVEINSPSSQPLTLIVTLKNGKVYELDAPTNSSSGEKITYTGSFDIKDTPNNIKSLEFKQPTQGSIIYKNTYNKIQWRSGSDTLDFEWNYAATGGDYTYGDFKKEFVNLPWLVVEYNLSGEKSGTANYGPTGDTKDYQIKVDTLGNASLTQPYAYMIMPLTPTGDISVKNINSTIDVDWHTININDWLYKFTKDTRTLSVGYLPSAPLTKNSFLENVKVGKNAGTGRFEIEINKYPTAYDTDIVVGASSGLWTFYLKTIRTEGILLDSVNFFDLKDLENISIYDDLDEQKEPIFFTHPTTNYEIKNLYDNASFTYKLEDLLYDETRQVTEYTFEKRNSVAPSAYKEYVNLSGDYGKLKEPILNRRGYIMEQDLSLATSADKAAAYKEQNRMGSLFRAVPKSKSDIGSVAGEAATRKDLANQSDDVSNGSANLLVDLGVNEIKPVFQIKRLNDYRRERITKLINKLGYIDGQFYDNFNEVRRNRWYYDTVFANIQIGSIGFNDKTKQIMSLSNGIKQYIKAIWGGEKAKEEEVIDDSTGGIFPTRIWHYRGKDSWRGVRDFKKENLEISYIVGNGLDDPSVPYNKETNDYKALTIRDKLIYKSISVDSSISGKCTVEYNWELPTAEGHGDIVKLKIDRGGGTTNLTNINEIQAEKFTFEYNVAPGSYDKTSTISITYEDGTILDGDKSIDYTIVIT